MGSVALQLEKMKSAEQLLPPRGPNVYASGLKDADKGYVKYGPPSSDQPSLLISEYLMDNDGNTISPGYYELSLSKDRQTLLLTQMQNLVATIPVFKLEEDKSQAQIIQPMTKKEQKKQDKAKKKAAKKTQKLIKNGEMTEAPAVYNNATIEYQSEGDYYLIKYERGRIQAWGAIKFWIIY